MKVILLQDVAKIGKRHSVAEVPDGFAQNKLIPSGQALPATKENLRQLEKRQAKASSAQSEKVAMFLSESKRLAEAVLSVPADANEQGHLFRALPKEAVLTACGEPVASLLQVEVIFSEPIKALGEHTVTLGFAGEKRAITINVVAEK